MGDRAAPATRKTGECGPLFDESRAIVIRFHLLLDYVTVTYRNSNTGRSFGIAESHGWEYDPRNCIGFRTFRRLGCGAFDSASKLLLVKTAIAWLKLVTFPRKGCNMARNDALLRLHAALVARRDELRKRIAGGYINDLRSTDKLGDAADMAFGNAGEEVNSQLVQLESRELTQIDVALRKLKQGTYGVCEGCAKKIPVARLNALPFSSTCIGCKREMELYGDEGRGGRGDWEKVSDASFDEKEVRLSDLEVDYSSR